MLCDIVTIILILLRLYYCYPWSWNSRCCLLCARVNFSCGVLRCTCLRCLRATQQCHGSNNIDCISLDFWLQIQQLKNVYSWVQSFHFVHDWQFNLSRWHRIYHQSWLWFYFVSWKNCKYEQCNNHQINKFIHNLVMGGNHCIENTR